MDNATKPAFDEAYDRRRFEIHTLDGTDIQFEVMAFGGRRANLAQILILPSVEFPIPPSENFCDFMLERGYQVVFVRRPGFGSSSPLPDPLLHHSAISRGMAAVTEAALTSQLIKQLELRNTVVMAMGTANPMATRLACLSSDVALTLMVNPMLNQNPGQLGPAWFHKILIQVLSSRSALLLTSRGLRQQLKGNPIAFYKRSLARNGDDKGYISENTSDFLEAGRLLLETDVSTFLSDIKLTLAHDDFLSDGLFRRLNVVSLVGHQSTDQYISQTVQESDRVSASIELAPNGDFLVGHTNPEFVLEVIQKRFARANTTQV